MYRIVWNFKFKRKKKKKNCNKIYYKKKKKVNKWIEVESKSMSISTKDNDVINQPILPKKDAMIEIFQKAFRGYSNSASCFSEVSDAHFFIYDPQQGDPNPESTDACILYLPNVINEFKKERSLEIRNDSSKALIFIAVDKCVVSDSSKRARCDCVIFEIGQKFIFCELKLGNPNASFETLPALTWEGAISQLDATVTLFKEVNVLRKPIEYVIGAHTESILIPTSIQEYENLFLETRRISLVIGKENFL